MLHIFAHFSRDTGEQKIPLFRSLFSLLSSRRALGSPRSRESTKVGFKEARIGTCSLVPLFLCSEFLVPKVALFLVLDSFLVPWFLTFVVILKMSRL